MDGDDVENGMREWDSAIRRRNTDGDTTLYGEKQNGNLSVNSVTLFRVGSFCRERYVQLNVRSWNSNEPFDGCRSAATTS